MITSAAIPSWYLHSDTYVDLILKRWAEKETEYTFTEKVGRFLVEGTRLAVGTVLIIAVQPLHVPLQPINIIKQLTAHTEQPFVNERKRHHASLPYPSYQPEDSGPAV